MPYLIALVVVLALVCGVNLVFTLGVVRRLREHTRLLNDERRRPRPNMGDVPAPFSATTTDGRTVSRESLPAPLLIGFFSAGCRPCEEALPEFVRYAAAFPGGREHVLAVVNGPAEDVEESRERLAATAQVITELPDGPVQTAFAVDGTPAFGIVDGNRVVLTSTRLVADLPDAVPA
ncbi:TlpA disulfide reductase family protein [Actinomadura sp. WAC 06369]|uniref:TlpA disulfide reductase family protein n=1 Tax=Actinomadura sp. WAC 06369 TaxID=2203193 RepID=UPI000F76D038|nr:TlpA disulfide reductase family protein [Actinomadura sp. WAC 06369]RSN71326.1 TlpA family protein [Actinomadura sp. WAC 06369]